MLITAKCQSTHVPSCFIWWEHEFALVPSVLLSLCVDVKHFLSTYFLKPDLSMFCLISPLRVLSWKCTVYNVICSSITLLCIYCHFFNSTIHPGWQRRGRSMQIPFHLPGREVWRMHHLRQGWWLPLVFHHWQLWRWQILWVLPWDWYVLNTTYCFK